MVGGQKIIEGLKQALAGDLARVTINGQTWVRVTDLNNDVQEIMRINNVLRDLVLAALKTCSDDNWIKRAREAVK